MMFGIKFAYGDNTLQDISFTALPSNKVQLRLTLTNTATVPNTFTIDVPPRLVLDFPNTKLALPSKSIMIGIGAVRSVSAVEADNRTRVVFNFDRKVTYDLKLRANTVLVNMDNQLNVATQKTRIQVAKLQSPQENLPTNKPSETVALTKTDLPPNNPPVASTSVKKPPSTKKFKSKLEVTDQPTQIVTTETKVVTEAPIEPDPLLAEPIVAEQTSSSTTPQVDEQPESVTKNQSSLQNIDFRRGANGEGQILITLSDPTTPINLTQKGDNVIVEALNVKLPKKLHQKLNVGNFATPIQTILSKPKGNDVHINVKAHGDYEYVAYQVDKLYTLEFYPLTPEEQEKKKKESKVYTGERLTLNFQDIPVRSLLNLLGDFVDRNMVISDAVQGNVTLRLKNVPWDQALDIILKTKFLGKRENESIIYIAPNADLIAQEQAELEADKKIEEELAPLKIELIQLNYADAEKIRDVLKDAGKSTKSTKIDVTSRSANIKTGSTNSVLQSSDEESLLSARGQVTVYTQTNSLIIQDTAEQLEKIRNIISKLDIPSKQVLIESRIVIASNDFSKDLGVRFGWSGARDVGSNEVNIGGGLPGHIEGSGTMNHGTWSTDVTGKPFGAGFEEGGTENLMVNLPSANPTGAVNLLVGKIGSYLLQLELSAMQNEGRGEIISSPRVIASNQETAIIEQGTEIPYEESTTSGATSITFKKAVLSLEVTPRITADARVSMALKVNQDTPHDFGSFVGVDTRSVETNVLVNNGETIVLGGVYVRTREDTKTSVPFFGGIPGLGVLFRRTSSTDVNSELLIFVTPKILQSEAMQNQ
jgi:type IV pilus assembly protein PilQ